MFEKVIAKLYQWSMKRAMARHQKKNMTESQKKRQEMYVHLRELYSFVRWLNTKGLGNRHQRKAFWREVREGKPVIENVLNQLLNKYAPKSEEDLKRETEAKKKAQEEAKKKKEEVKYPPVVNSKPVKGETQDNQSS